MQERSGRPTLTLKDAIDVYGAETSLLRHLNRNEVLRFLRKSGEAHGISVVARETELSRPTVDLALRDLAERGLVLETTQTVSSPRGGRPAREFRFDAWAGCVAAVTVTNHELLVVIADLRDQVIGERRVRFDDLNQEPDPPACIKAAVDHALSECAQTPDGLRIAVIGVRGIVSAGGVIKVSGELPSLVGEEVHRRLTESFDCPVLIENDANLATLAEHRNLAGPDNVVGLLIGEGLGCGLVVNGELYRGAHGAAGEFFGEDKSRSWTATNRAIRDYGKQRDQSFAAIFRTARLKPGRARTLVARYAGEIAERIGALLVLDPPVIVVGGEIVEAGDVFLAPFRAALEPYLYGDTKIIYSDLGADCLRSGALQVAADWMDKQLFQI